MVPLQKKPRKLLLVGDPKQLPATVMSPEAIKYGLPQSLQERLMYQNRHPYTMLDVQYRMRPEIASWPVREFYGGKVEDGNNVVESDYGTRVPLLLDQAPYTWVPVLGEELKDSLNSTFNEREAETIVAMLLEWKKQHRLGENKLASPDFIRIITFYKAREDYLRELLRKYKLDVTLSTVDSTQGCEADIVILSFVRGTSGHVGFLKDDRRLNVALTRAKYQLVCVGNLDAIRGLATKGGHYTLRSMANDAFKRAHIVPPPGPLPPPPPPNMPSRTSDSTRKSAKKKSKNDKKSSKKKSKRDMTKK